MCTDFGRLLLIFWHDLATMSAIRTLPHITKGYFSRFTALCQLSGRFCDGNSEGCER